MAALSRKLVLLTVSVIGVLVAYKLLFSKLKNRFTYIVGQTWNGSPLEGEKVVVQLQTGPPGMLKMRVEAPFYSSPGSPAGPPGEPFPQLWDYEVVEAFFLSDSGKYLEVELCPHGQHLVLMLDGKRKMIKEKLPIQFTSEISGQRWVGVAHIPVEYFPPQVSKFNAYAIHGPMDNRQYEAYMAVPGDQPDFHRLEYFEPIKFSSLVPENANDKVWPNQE